MHRIIGTALALALLTGCSSKSDSGGNGSAGAAAGGQQSQEPANATESQTNMAIPVTPPSPTPITAIPSPFQGRWGMVGADCTPAGAGAAKGLMTITADRVAVPGSTGAPAHMRRLTPQALVLDLPMSDGGKNRSEPTRLTLQGDGRSIVRQTTGAGGHAAIYQRCPA